MSLKPFLVSAFRRIVNKIHVSHIHTLFSLYTLSLKQQDIMCNMCFLPSTGISARIFAKWLELPTLNEINDLIETGFVQTTKRRTISLHPMIQEITLSETKPSVTRCHILLDSLTAPLVPE